MCLIHPTVTTRASISLLSLPLETRWEIYYYLTSSAVHIFLRDGTFFMSTCVVSIKHDDQDLCGEERMTTGDVWTDTIWMRRIRSTWGSHWQCEELALRRRQNVISQADITSGTLPLLSALSVSRLM